MPANDALLLIGHGSDRYPEAGSMLYEQVEALCGAAPLQKVAVAFLHGAPSVAQAMRGLADLSVRVVPFFMEDGYFTRVAIPRALGLGDDSAGLGRDLGYDVGSIRLCPPVGIHDDMPMLIRRRALRACSTLGIPPETAAVVVIGHGSASAPGRALALHGHAARLKEAGDFAAVAAACLEEPPFLADVLGRLRRYPLIAVGFFANQGGHVRDDVPALLDAERRQRHRHGPPLHFAGCVADDPAMVGIILQQAGKPIAEGG